MPWLDSACSESGSCSGERGISVVRSGPLGENEVGRSKAVMSTDGILCNPRDRTVASVIAKEGSKVQRC